MASTAIVEYTKFKSLVQGDDVQARFKALLNKRGPAFLASLLSVVGNDNKLMECEPSSILTSAAKAAILNLPIEPALGFAYIVPFKKRATFILGYKGMIQLAIRTGQYNTINATEIYEGEEVIVDRLTGLVKLNGKRTGNTVTGYISFFKLKNGFEKFLHMDTDSVLRHAEQYSKAYQYGMREGKKDSPWFTDFDGMGKKTVLRLLLGKYGLMSIDMQDSDTPPDPALADDPRFEMPNFDDVIDGQSQDAPPEDEQEKQYEIPQPLDDVPLELSYPPEFAIITNSAGEPYVNLDSDKLKHMRRAMGRKLDEPNALPPDQRAQYEKKCAAIDEIIRLRGE